MSYSQGFRTSNDNGYIWDGNMCSCCPYGYHIDLDFVRYCESVSQEADRTGSIKRRKDRRRQRQSMEVLLGITPPVIAVLEQSYKPIQEQETTKIIETSSGHFPISQDAFDDAVSDFERTLQRSKNKLSNNLPDVTAVSETIKRVPSNSSMSSASGSSMTVLPEATNRDFDTVSIESCGLSSLALQSIREQMAISLERTKLLEDQVKLIPQLKVCFPVYFQMFFANCVINSVLPVSVVVKYIKLSLRSKITFSFFHTTSSIVYRFILHPLCLSL
jgi:hypothetical protein